VIGHFLLRHCPVVLGCVALVVAVGCATNPVFAEPEPLSDRDLDSVSARGYRYPNFSFGRPFGSTSVSPFVPVSGKNDSDIANVVFSFTNTTNVNTALNLCLYSTCDNSGASITSDPVSSSPVNINNEVVPTLQNVVSVPTALGSPPGFQPSPTGGADSFVASPSRHGLLRRAPPLPKSSFGVN
jgi:hypothetical protein